MKKHQYYRYLLLFVICTMSFSLFAKDRFNMRFTVSMPQPASHYFHVELKCNIPAKTATTFKLPNWSPGYYQLMNFAANVENFTAKDIFGVPLKWSKATSNSWIINPETNNTVTIEYDVKTTRKFVGTSWVDAEHGYIIPASLFLHIAGHINTPSTVIVQPYSGWSNVATGLDSIKGKPFTYTAPDFDILYDCPILIGNLEELPAFTVSGIPHRFIGYKIGDFDKLQFMADLKKIVETASGLFGDIPYKHYTFLGIGEGQGGIEHLNSTAISFNGKALETKEGRERVMHFIAHEYYHHYNVKRIRPIELGPFDYDKGNRTNMLWVSEGLSVYYEYVVVHRAGISSMEDMLRAISGNIMNYENKPGHLFQSLTQSSWETWSDDFFTPSGESVYKTISYYDKGPAIGMLLDLEIRHATRNKYSLDDVMKTAYNEFYKKKKRGFTEKEFRQLCEKIAGKKLDEIYDYITTTKPVDYGKYLAYAGLMIDTSSKEKPGAYSGMGLRPKGDSVMIGVVDWQSNPYNQGLRAGTMVLKLDGQAATYTLWKEIMKKKQPGDVLNMEVLENGVGRNVIVTLTTKKERGFSIKRIEGSSSLAATIWHNWSR